MSEETIKELNHKYQNTYVAVLRGSVKWPLYVEEFVAGGNKKPLICKGHVAYRHDTGITWAPAEINLGEDSLYTSFPEEGLKNHKGFVVHFLRKAARQWKRGVTHENSFGKILLNEVTDAIKISPLELAGPDYFYDIYNPLYYEFEAAIDALRSGSNLAVALNKNYFLFLYPYVSDIQIGYKGLYPIGHVHKGQVVMLDTFKYLIEDMSQYIPVRG